MSTVVVKIGGALIDSAEAIAAVWAGVDGLRAEHEVVVVHGGGVQTSAATRLLGEEPQIVAGRRITTDRGLEALLWTVRGALNARLVSSARAAGLRAVGLSGVDAGLVTVAKRPPVEVDGETVDFGWVGDVITADPTLLRVVSDAGFLPVIASPCADDTGGIYNVNADTVALTLAAALDADALLLVADAGGVFHDFPDAASLLPTLDADAFERGLADGRFHGGMRPKLEIGFEAVGRGVGHVRICAPHGLADSTSGTVLLA